MTWRTDLIEQAAKAAYEGSTGLSGSVHVAHWDTLPEWWRRQIRQWITDALPIIADALTHRADTAAAYAEMRGKPLQPANDPDDYDGDLFEGTWKV